MNSLWKKDTLFFGGDTFFGNIFSQIDQAQNQIDLEAYIFENDKLGKKMIQHLSKATTRGVRVRVLVDGAGSAKWLPEIISAMRKTKIDCRVYRPLPSKIDFVMLAKVFFLADSQSKKKLHWFNGRNHRKTILVDNRVAFVGSMNVTAKHLYEISGTETWRDTGVRLEGNLSPLSEAFERAWQNYRSPLREEISLPKEKKTSITRDLVRLNDSRLKRRLFNFDLVRRIEKAERNIWITNAYFIPKPVLIWALRRAARRKVDVRIIVPEKSDVIFIPWLTKLFYARLLKAGVRIYEYQARFLHAKTMIVDDWCLVGTSNLNYRSFHHDLEVDAVITSAVSKKKLSERFIADLSNSHEITKKELFMIPSYQKFAGNFLFPMRYWF